MASKTYNQHNQPSLGSSSSMGLKEVHHGTYKFKSQKTSSQHSKSFVYSNNSNKKPMMGYNDHSNLTNGYHGYGNNNGYGKYIQNSMGGGYDEDEYMIDEPLNAWDKYQYTKLFTALKDLEKYAKISIPEFVFVGFQSSGKTSAVSQAAKLAVGVMKHGTASRCPTRFKLISNPNQHTPLIKVNGVECKDEYDLTNKTLEIHKKYEDEKRFSKKIIEVRIESSQVPELTFVDLPGLIKGDNQKFRKEKRQLDELTAHFLHELNPDGSYRYIPILVREPVDIEHDNDIGFEIEYIDNLIQRYGRGYNKRIGWKNDALFIVNKFDLQLHRSPASSLIEYMKHCCKYGQTVLTIMNAKNQNTANMTQDQLNEFVINVEKYEEEKWNEVIAEFGRMDDENLDKLIASKNDVCGVGKMNELLAEKMCDIVKKILPSIEQQLDAAEQSKEHEIAAIIKQIAMCNPKKLKRQCVAFNNRFLQFLKEFYNGSLTPRIGDKYHKSWAQEVNDFHITRNKSNWIYEIPPSKLQKLLKKSLNVNNYNQHERRRKHSRYNHGFNNDQEFGGIGRQDDGKPGELLRLLDMKLVASSAVNRIIDAWVCQMAYMPFPRYDDEKIVNICGTFYATKQPELWTSVRNVVLDAIGYLVDGSIFLAEMFRYRLKENADIIFDYTLNREFGNITEMQNDSIVKLLKRSLRDYKKEIDNIIDEFIKVASVGPKNLAQILDKQFCEETINIGRLVDILLDPENKDKYRDETYNSQPMRPWSDKNNVDRQQRIFDMDQFKKQIDESDKKDKNDDDDDDDDNNDDIVNADDHDKDDKDKINDNDDDDNDDNKKDDDNNNDNNNNNKKKEKKT